MEIYLWGTKQRCKGEPKDPSPPGPRSLWASERWDRTQTVRVSCHSWESAGYPCWLGAGAWGDSPVPRPPPSGNSRSREGDRMKGVSANA